MKILFTGINGELGRSFAKLFSNSHEIVGVGTGDSKTNIKHYIKKDVSIDAELIVDEAINILGEINAVVNSAVFYDNGPLENSSSDKIIKSLFVNLVGPQQINRFVVNKSMKYTGGKIINIGSFSGKHFNQNWANYSISKAALNMLTKFEANEYVKYKISSNILCPTTFPKLIETDKISVELEKLLRTHYMYNNGKSLCIGSENNIWWE